MDLLADDQQLLRDFKRGENVALTRVYKAYLPDIFNFLKNGFAFNSKGNRYFFKGYREPWHLENAMQDIFSRAFSQSARDAYDGIRPYRNYLFRIARNTVMDAFRDQKKDLLNISDLEPALDNTVSDHPDAADPETLLFEKQLAEQVQQFTDQLPQELVAFFNARFNQGESVEGCAKRFGWSEHRVKREEKQIKKRFFCWLQERGYFRGYRYQNHRAMRLAGALLMICCRQGI